MAAGQGPIIVSAGGGPNILLRVIYFLAVGWWLGALVSAVAWLCNITIIGLPVGLWLINRLPSVITLRSQEMAWHYEEGLLVRGKVQRPFWLRAVYFLLCGWWFSGLWIVAAYGLLLSILGIPLAFWMFGRIGAVTSLYRS